MCESFITMQGMNSFDIRHSTPETWTVFSSLMHETSRTRAETKTSLDKWHHCCVQNGQLNIWKSCLINSNLDSEYVDWPGVPADSAGVFPLNSLLPVGGSCDLAVREWGVHSCSYECLQIEARTLLNYIYPDICLTNDKKSLGTCVSVASRKALST